MLSWPVGPESAASSLAPGLGHAVSPLPGQRGSDPVALTLCRPDACATPSLAKLKVRVEGGDQQMWASVSVSTPPCCQREFTVEGDVDFSTSPSSL